MDDVTAARAHPPTWSHGFVDDTLALAQSLPCGVPEARLDDLRKLDAALPRVREVVRAMAAALDATTGDLFLLDEGKQNARETIASIRESLDALYRDYPEALSA